MDYFRNALREVGLQEFGVVGWKFCAFEKVFCGIMCCAEIVRICYESWSGRNDQTSRQWIFSLPLSLVQPPSYFTTLHSPLPLFLPPLSLLSQELLFPLCL